MPSNKCLWGSKTFQDLEPFLPFDPFEPWNPERRRPRPKRPFEVVWQAALKEPVLDG